MRRDRRVTSNEREQGGKTSLAEPKDRYDVREAEENSRRRNAASQSRSQTHVTLIGQYSKISAVSYIARPAIFAGLALAKLSVISQLD